MAKLLRKKQIGIQYRTCDFDRAMVNKEKRTVDLSFSSEQPVKRWWGNEVLSHEDGCCNMARLMNGAPLLDQHDSRRQIGVVESANIQDKKGRATVRFGSSALANEIFQDVQDGIRTKVSVGYLIEHMQMEEMDGDPDDDAEATYRADKWTPYEISLVSIPADDTVGVGREVEKNNHAETVVEYSMKSNNPSLKRDAEAAPAGGGAPANNGPAILEAANSEKSRIREITTMGTRFRKQYANAVADASEAVEKDWSIEKFRTHLMDKIATAPEPLNTEVESQGRLAQARTVGEYFTNSERYRAAIKSVASTENRTMNVEAPLTPSEIALWCSRGMSQMSERATATSSGLTSIQKLQEVMALGVVPMRVADLIMPGETNNTTIRFIQESSFTNAAAAVDEEGQIPEMSWSLAEVDATVKKIAVVGRVTDELFADYAAVRSYIDQRLAYAVGIKEDSELINGVGTTTHIKGILAVTGINTQAVVDNVVDSCWKALVKVRTTGWAQPSAFIMNPQDWSNIRLSKDKNGQYLFGGPSTGPYGYGPFTVSGFMWALPVIETTSIAQGTILTGAFNQDCQLFRRLGLTVETTNSDASDFQYNRICIRAATRLTLATYRPLSFCSVTGVPNVP